MRTTTNNIVKALLVFALLWIAVCSLSAQTLLIKGNVTFNHTSSLEKYTVKVLDMNNDLVVTFNAVKSFKYELQYDNTYTIVIYKEGYQPKSIYIDTHCNSKESFKYPFDCNLKPNEDKYVVQAGKIFYNNNKREFDYSYSK